MSEPTFLAFAAWAGQLATRVAALEQGAGGGGLNAEAVQDLVAGMFPGAIYDDPSGTITLPEGSSLDAEQVRAIVAQFAVAGANVTITHNDELNTLTVSAAGGGGGGTTGGTVGTLTRTAGGGAGTAVVTETFATDPLASGVIAPTTGEDGTSLSGLAYDAAGQRLLQTDGSSSPHYWTYQDAPLRALVDYAADVTLLTDPAGRRSLGLWVQTNDGAGQSGGYTFGTLDGNLRVCWKTATLNVYNVVMTAPYTWNVGETKRLRIVINFVTGVGQAYADGVLMGTWTHQLFAGGKAGGFSYGNTVAWDNLTLPAPAAQVTGLPAGATLRSGALTGAGDKIALPGASRVDVCSADGAVLASGYLTPGEVWAYSAAAAAGSGSGGPVPLSTSGTPSFLPTNRIPGDAGNYRTMGPVMTAGATALTYAAVRVPLRPDALNSSHYGTNVVLYQINLAGNVVVKRLTLSVDPGVETLTYTGPFVVPPSQSHAFVVGASGGNWDGHIALFYGANGQPYAAPYAAVNSAWTDGDPTTNEGGVYNVASGTGRHRTVLLDGVNIPKGVVGSLDAADLPGYADAPVGSVMTRTASGAAFQASVATFNKAYNTELVNPSAGGWFKVPLNAVPSGNAFVNSTFTAPAAGLYLITASLVMDQLQVGDNINLALFLNASFSGGSYQNGTGILSVHEGTQGAAGVGAWSGAATLLLASGDRVEMWINSSGGRRILGGVGGSGPGQTQMAVTRLS